MKIETVIEKLESMPDSYFKYLKVCNAGMKMGIYDKTWFINECNRLTKLGYNKAK